MDKNQIKTSHLYIPRGVVKGKQWMEGYGKKEAIQSIFLLLFLSPLWLIISIWQDFNYFSILLLFGLFLFSISVCVKVEQVSAYDSILRIIRYYNSVKKYTYQKVKERSFYLEKSYKK